MRDLQLSRLPDGRLRFSAFVPRLISHYLNAAAGDAAAPAVTHFPAAVMVADCSGFSALAEHLAERRSSGAEALKDLLNRVFGPIIRQVQSSGGDIAAFPGDAVVAVWPTTFDANANPAACAVQCALAVQRQLATTDSEGEVPLRLRIGVGVGDVWAAHVGGVSDCWHLVVGGDSLNQAIRAVPAAAPGDVVVSSSVCDRITGSAQGHSVGDGLVCVRHVTAVAVPHDDRPHVAPDDAMLRRYVPRAVQTRMDAGQTEWLAESRHASIAFIDIGHIDCTTSGGLARLQRGVAAIQTALERYGGSINQVAVDDKGTVVTCGWGLALHAHADDPVRAGRAVLDIRRELARDDIHVSVGLATGDVFTGLRGTLDRCDYAMIGAPVNRAARLMQAARGYIFCDVSFFEAARKRLAFEAHGSLNVKGTARAVDVYRLRGLAEGRVDIVGREQEQRVLDERLDALVREGAGSMTIVEGEPGIGKSHLLGALVERAGTQGVRCIVASGDAIERSTPYHVWRHLFRTVLRLGPEARGETRVRMLLRDHEKLWSFAPLLNPVLGLSLEENERSRGVPPRGRALLTRDLLVELFRRAVGEEPTLIVLDDTHWFDSASWALVEGIQREMPGVMLVIAQRFVPLAARGPEQGRLNATPGTLVLRLGPLSTDATRRLVCLRLRARALDPAVERLFEQKAQGHPFFTDELAHALRDRGLVHVAEGVCRFSGAGAHGESTLLPNTVQVMVSSRIDQLPIPQQLTIKIASIFGQPFDLAALRAIHPIQTSDETLTTECQALVDADLLRRTSASPPMYAFKHALTQEVAYGLLPFAQRRELHASVAAWYEAESRSAPADAAVLAYHWTRAEVADRAVIYLERAGEDALGRFANEEAERLYADAIAIDAKRVPDSTDASPLRVGRRRVDTRDARRVHWYRRLGDATANLGRWAEARGHFERALVLLGERPPGAGWALGIVREIVTQFGHRTAPRFVRRCPADAADLLHEVVCAFERMGAISYLMEQTPALFYSLLAALNRAERLSTDGDTALIYADVGNIAGMIPAHVLARRYNIMARGVAARLDTSPLLARALARASVYRIAVGDWDSCTDLARSMAICEQLGDSYQWEESAAIRARAAHLRGEFELAVTLGSEIRRRARDNRSSAHEVWGVDAEVWGLWYLGEHQRALDLANRGLVMMNEARRPDRVPMLDFLGAIALGLLSTNDLKGARTATQNAADTLHKLPRPGHMATIAISAVVEAAIGLWELDPGNRDARKTAEGMLNHFARYATLNPTAIPRLHLWRGCSARLCGRPLTAQRHWARCIVEGEQRLQPYEVARARYEIGRASPFGDARDQALRAAAAGFERLNAVFDRNRVAAALALSERRAAL